MTSVRRIPFGLICAALAAIGTTNCASALHRSRGFNTPPQQIVVTSDPLGAIVRLDGVIVGVTPANVFVRRKGPVQTLFVEKEGFVTFELPLRRELSGAAYGNLGFMALPFHPLHGLADDGMSRGQVAIVSAGIAAAGFWIDHASGAAYAVRSPVHVTLKKQ